MTSYVKMIDIWLLFVLIVPFIEVFEFEIWKRLTNNFFKVFLQTYIEDLRGKLEDSKEMNHHGRSVTVDTVNDVTPVQ